MNGPMAFALDLNPEPWTAPSISVGRKGGKPFPMVYKNEALRSYQQAVKEMLSGHAHNGHHEGPLDLRFFFWRQLPDYTTDDEVRARKHHADATNLQKALEDALQGVLFKNDRDVRHIETWVMAQGKDVAPLIVIQMRPAGIPPVLDLSAWVQDPIEGLDDEPFFKKSASLF